MRASLSGRTSWMRLFDLGRKGKRAKCDRTLRCDNVRMSYLVTTHHDKNRERGARPKATRRAREVGACLFSPQGTSARPKAARNVAVVGSPAVFGTGPPKIARNWFCPSTKPPPTTL